MPFANPSTLLPPAVMDHRCMCTNESVEASTSSYLLLSVMFYLYPLMGQCLASVVIGGPTLIHEWVSHSFLLECYPLILPVPANFYISKSLSFWHLIYLSPPPHTHKHYRQFNNHLGLHHNYNCVEFLKLPLLTCPRSLVYGSCRRYTTSSELLYKYYLAAIKYTVHVHLSAIWENTVLVQ